MDIPATKPAPATTAATGSTGKFKSVSLPAHEAKPTPAPTEPVDIEVPQVTHTEEAIAEAVSRYLQTSTRNLEFQVDKEEGAAVIVVRDAEGNVIRRIPGEEALEVMRRSNADSGTLIDSLA